MRHSSLPVAAELFGEGWSRVRSASASGGADPRASASLHRSAQMVRAARGARPAVFKAIRHGGCHTGAQLRTQLAHLCTKSSLILDACGTYDGQAVLTPVEIDAVARRFEARWEAERRPKLGHTSHLLMSFPIGTRLGQVAGVARDVCEQFFQGEGARFDYVVAVHEDRAHRHAHVVLNRQSPDGEVFFLREGHRFSYGLFREAMALHGERHGLHLEATRRLDRGVLTYNARPVEVQQAREAGREVVERHRAGGALERGRGHVALAASTCRGLAEEARADGLGVVQAGLGRASQALGRGEAVAGAREALSAKPYLGDWRGFEGLVRTFADGVGQVEARIVAADPQARPRLEAGLHEVLGPLAHLNPLGPESPSLREPAREDGFYARAGLERSPLVGLDDARVTGRVEAALAGTGIAAGEVLARLEVGAPSAALERQWLLSDVRALAERDRLDLGQDGDAERALDRLDAVQDQIVEALRAGGREVMVEALKREEEAERHAAREAHAQGALRLAQEQERERDLAAERARAAQVEAHRAQAARAAEAELIAAVVERLRDAFSGDPAFRSAREARAFREAVERRLEPRELAGLADDRLGRLCVAKAYLESGVAAEQSAVHMRVVRGISHAQIDARREREGHEDDGWTHG